MTSQPKVKAIHVTRKGLLGSVRSGLLSPEDADEAAIGAGLGPFSRYLSPDESWPTAKTHWTLPMVLAWIAWRTYGEVREWDAEYIALRRDWGLLDKPRPTGQAAGYGLFRRKRPTSTQFRQWGAKLFGPWIVGRDGRPAVLLTATPAEAASTLWRSLESGELVAHGIHKDGEPRVEIPARYWLDIKVVVGREGREELQIGLGSARVIYRDVLFALRSILAIWPPHRLSGLPDQADFQYSPMVNNQVAQADIFEPVRLADLDASLSERVARGYREYNYSDLKDLEIENRKLVKAGRPPMTVAQTREWSLDRGITRGSMREMLREIKRNSSELRRSRGKTGS